MLPEVTDDRLVDCVNWHILFLDEKTERHALRWFLCIALNVCFLRSMWRLLPLLTKPTNKITLRLASSSGKTSRQGPASQNSRKHHLQCRHYLGYLAKDRGHRWWAVDHWSRTRKKKPRNSGQKRYKWLCKSGSLASLLNPCGAAEGFCNLMVFCWPFLFHCAVTNVICWLWCWMVHSCLTDAGTANYRTRNIRCFLVSKPGKLCWSCCCHISDLILYVNNIKFLNSSPDQCCCVPVWLEGPKNSERRELHVKGYFHYSMLWNIIPCLSCLWLFKGCQYFFAWNVSRLLMSLNPWGTRRRLTFQATKYFSVIHALWCEWSKMGEGRG